MRARKEREFRKLETNAGTKEEKEGDVFILDPVVTKVPAPLDYSVSVNDTVSLVGKRPVMTRLSPRASMPYVAGVGQMKLEAPPRYSRKK